MPGLFVPLTVPDYDGTSGGVGYGYRIGDNFVLTAGHVFFDWNRDNSGTLLEDIEYHGSPTIFDYRGYRSQYLTEVLQEIAAGSPYPSNALIEGQGQLPQRDTVVISNSGSLSASGHGLVLFLDRNDLEHVTTSVDAGARTYRDGHTTMLRPGTIVSTTSNGLLQFSNLSVDGDSGGVYLLRTGGKYYVIGSHSGNNGSHSQGTYFSSTEWRDINDLLEPGHSGNITTTEPTNMVIGSSGGDFIIGSFRPDIIRGRGGNDVILDGDSPFDAVWANDTLIGGAGDDQFTAGAGNDTIWGGDENDDSVAGGGTDSISYISETGGITIHFDGTTSTPVITISGVTTGTDILHSIESIYATEHSDRFEYIGTIATGYSLTVDMGGNPDTLVDLGGADSAMEFTNGVIRNKEGDTSGVITLQNVSTMISGTMYDDEITDESDGDKRIFGGLGDDVITVDGGRSIIRGGLGDDEINGGSGNDRLFGEDGKDIVHGGGGSDWLENQHYDDLPPNSAVVDDDELYGDEGADYLYATASSYGATLIGGAGNDVIDARESHGVAVRFGAGDGHDMILSDRELGVDYPVGEEPYDGVGTIDMSTVSKSEVTFVWNPTYVIEDHYNSGGEAASWLWRQGDLAIRINATGDTILIKNIRGTTTYINDPSEASSPPFDDVRDFVDLHEITEMVLFSDGYVTYEDFLGADPLVGLAFGSLAAYETALDEYRAATDGDPEENTGTGGDDSLDGGSGDDDIDGGDGNDSFHGSGGTDTIDGGTGTDRLVLWGSRDNFTITRDPDTGDVTLQDKTGAEGKITIKSVEKIYFASDNEELEPGDLVGFWGTPGNDALVQGNARDNQVYGLEGNDLLRGLDGNDTLYGQDGTDTLEGGAGNDVLDGGAGADAMIGGAGDDAYYLVDTGDTATESAGGGSDEIRTNAASYTLASNFERLTGLLATGQTLTGNSLANVLTGGAGADTLNGGSGSDTAAWTWSEAGVTVDLQNNILSGDAAGDTLISIENLTGGSGADALSGTSAANILDGGGGEDVLTGRGGSDIYYVDDAGDVVVEAAGQGNDEIRTTLDFYSLEDAANVEVLRYVGTENFEGLGGDGNDVIYGGSGSDNLYGGAGIDTLIGGDGNDDLMGEADGDVLDGRAGADYMAGGTGNDVYTVDDQGDLIEELSGEGTDLVYTTLFEYALTDEVENLSGSSGEGQVLIGNDLANVILGAGGSDIIEGGDGNDELRGGAGHDEIRGGGGDDLIVGNSGVDLMTGGAGADTFRFFGWDTGYLVEDRIDDFVSGEDKIDLNQIDAGFGIAGMQHFSFVGTAAFSNTAGELRYGFDGTDTYVEGDWDGDGGADVRFLLTGEITLVATDFILV